ncbi:NADH-quinone oxidoreductase subunit NuoE [Nocardiopsis metallicus]|uniref:NADH-quinone oxidoreductase subunit E n=1 Tax=Nocardiopsis metallicus TaxID=179819 RepID=A0A840WEV7_9ACTN|nr:NADH-quinone oxidoreductase subunit NuoE [Nocardiopsis metallicus]MBB5494654.1 NADH-quinone oxidoreductase subunit E [Nocardiopsis metallicus]
MSEHNENNREEGTAETPGVFTDEVVARLAQDAKEIISRYPKPRSSLLPLLHLVQSEEGHVSAEGMQFCADQLDITLAEVKAVATFYTMYRREPGGDYQVGVCTNTLCAVMGGDEIFSALKEHLDVANAETTGDGKVTLEHVECNAACDFAPVVMVNWEFFDNQTPATAKQLVDDLRLGKDVAPTRGPASLCTWKQASRVLAGFDDGRAGEGVQAAGPSLAGLRIAERNGWSAPDPNNLPAPEADDQGKEGAK